MSYLYRPLLAISALLFFIFFFILSFGRVYTNAKLSITNQSPRSFLWLVTGHGEMGAMPGVHSSSVLLSLGPTYRPPSVLLHVGEDDADEIVVSGRSSFQVEDGPSLGFSYDTPEDCMFWMGIAAYSHPLVAECMFVIGDEYDMSVLSPQPQPQP
jgi:hypothetical protein